MSTTQGYSNEPSNLLAAGHHLRDPGQVQMQDVGPEWHLEHPQYNQGSGSWPIQPSSLQEGSLKEVQGGFPSVHVQNQPQQVKFDSLWRELAPCGCLKRMPPPPPPSQPPFPLTPQNIPRIEKWMLETYAASAFNICTHQPLPKMTGLPPLRIHVKEDAVPVAVH